MRCQWGVLYGLAAAGVLAGCNNNGASKNWQAETERLEREVKKLSDQLSVQEARLERQETQIANLTRLGPDRLERLLRVGKIELPGPHAGDDDDGRPGDDGVRVMIRPWDQDGDLLKVAADITIEIYDLGNPEGSQKIGTHEFTAEQARKEWYSRFATGHYTLKCPWQKGPPAHTDLTVRVEFVDLLSGKTFNAQTVCKIKLTPASQPGG